MKLSGSIAKSVNLTLFGLVLALLTAPATASPTVYIVNGNSQFGVFDLTTGGFHAIEKPAPEPQANLVWGSSGSLFTLGTLSDNLESINPAPGATTIGPTGLPFFYTGMSTAFDLAGVKGKLYLTDFSNNLYAVNAKTGAVRLIGPTGMPPDPHVPFIVNPDGTINLCDEVLSGVGGMLLRDLRFLHAQPDDPCVAVTPRVDNLGKRLARNAQRIDYDVVHCDFLQVHAGEDAVDVPAAEEVRILASAIRAGTSCQNSRI